MANQMLKHRHNVILKVITIKGREETPTTVVTVLSHLRSSLHFVNVNDKIIVFVGDSHIFFESTDNAHEPNVNVPTSTHTLAKSFETNPEEIVTPKTTRNRRLFYAGDIDDDTHLTPKSSKKFITSLRKTVISQRKKLKTGAQKVRRQNIKLQSLKSVLQDLKKKNMISENALELLQVHRYQSNVISM